ncbi:MAG: DNA-directed RNA polymerase subunit beta [Candidatus Margulisbacteria bacterium]|nr:DNA-directed RNA polymerase subunit beta [Candidatus Margulisiibacteriota bacterium]
MATKTIAPRENLYNSKVEDKIKVPNLISLQIDSFEDFVKNGIKEELAAISPIKGFGNRLELEFLDQYKLDEPDFDVEECKERELTYSAPLRCKVRLLDKETGEVKEQEVYMGNIPVMTKKGTFLINGAERVIVSQFVRSPGVYFKEKKDKQGFVTFHATVIPNRGAWLEVETDKQGNLYVHINKVRKLPLNVFLGALGIEEKEMIKSIKEKELIKQTIEKSGVHGLEDSLREVYYRLKPGDPFNKDAAHNLMKGLFFNSKTFDLGKVGRYKMNNRLSLKVDENQVLLTNEDIFAVVNEIGKLMTGEGLTDDIDHLGNRRVRCAGELMQKQLRVGLARLERLINEQMTVNEPDQIVPQKLINIRPLMAVMREFFGTSQLSQFMDQTNPLAELTHRRRLSALGPGGLTKERAGFEVRDIHPSHYGRICVVETPEGQNAGLIGPLALFAKTNKFGFIETPYLKVTNGKISKDVVYLTADIEDYYRIAPYDIQSKDGLIVEDRVPVRYRKEFVYSKKEEVNYIGISPRQMFGISTSLIPFLEHNDANRALMGSNMQRQATPLVKPDRPYVGTGLEFDIAKYAGSLCLAEADGDVTYVDANKIVVKEKGNNERVYNLLKFQKSNQNTWVNQRPLVSMGQKIKEGDVLADGASTKEGELSLGKNLLIAFMPWEGLNFEDSVVISEKLVIDDMFTTVHISKFEVEVRTTKLGNEELTREVANVSEDLLSQLNEDGIIRVGAEVKPGDILVGKVTPKGESEPPAEEKLLRAIFGEKARDMKDTSLRVPPGEYGKIIKIKEFSKENKDNLPPGILKIVRIYIGHLRKVQIGDKVAGRHGNKGVISKILPIEDMPMLPDGTALDMILNPLGVPSRMNVGQIYETLLGNASHALNKHYEVNPFDEVLEEENSLHAIASEIEKAKLEKGFEWLDVDGKVNLRDGRTGLPFERPVFCGYMYMLKLIHQVDDKIHARSTGPYSLVTQQPLGGKAQFGGQRFGEMEVWALEAYGAAHVLQEMLTIKSDDVTGRAKAYESIIKGKTIQRLGVPESFKVLVRELRSIALDLKLLNEDNEEIERL